MAQETPLRRSLSLALLTCYGLGTILGAGIYVLVGKVAEEVKAPRRSLPRAPSPVGVQTYPLWLPLAGCATSSLLVAFQVAAWLGWTG